MHPHANMSFEGIAVTSIATSLYKLMYAYMYAETKRCGPRAPERTSTKIQSGNLGMLVSHNPLQEAHTDVS